MKRLLTNGSSSKVGENLMHNAIERWAQNDKMPKNITSINNVRDSFDAAILETSNDISHRN